MILKLLQLQSKWCAKIHEHLLFQLVLAVINDNTVIVTIESMNQSLDTRLLQVTNVGRSLTVLVPTS
jgi:hypothetical protein